MGHELVGEHLFIFLHDFIRLKSFQDAINVDPNRRHRGGNSKIYMKMKVSMFMPHQALATQYLLVGSIIYCFLSSHGIC